MSAASSSPDELWDALDSLQLRLTPVESPSGKLGGVLGGLVSGASSAQEDASKPASESALVVLQYILYGSGKDVCGGRVGTDKVKFCSLECQGGSSVCGKVASHSKKTTLVTPAFYIRVPNHAYAYVQPCLPVPPSGFPADVTASLQGSRTVSAWMEIFAAYANIHLLDEADRQSIIQRFDASQEFSLSCGPTPMRFKKRRVEPPNQDGMEAMDDTTTGSWVTDSPEEPAPLLPTIFRMEDKIVHVVDSWNKLLTSNQNHRQSTMETQTEMKQFLETVDNKVVKLVAVIGSHVPEHAPAPTVWSSIYAHQDAIEAGQKVVTDLKVLMEASFGTMDKEVKDIRRGIRQSVLPTLNSLTERVTHMPVSGGSPLSDNQPSYDDLVATMLQFRNELNQLRAAQSAGRENGAGGEMDDLRSELVLLKEEVEILKVENQRLQAASNTDLIEFGGHIFNSPNSYVTWVATHTPSAYFGLCFDFISVLECFSNFNRIAEDGLKMAESIKKAGYKDKQVAIIDQSFGCTFPKVFGEEQDGTNPAKKMAKLKTVEDWENPTANTGLKVRINTFITAFRKTIDAQILKRFSYGTVANNFYSSLIQHTIKFWEAFGSWITRFERELTHRSGGDNFKVHQENTWNLICWMIHSMFVEMNTRRSPGSVGLAMDEEDNDSGQLRMEKCAAILHGTLAAHKFMAELISAEFIRHPIFASTMDEFLLTNKAAHVTVETLVVKVKKLEERVNGIQAVADRTSQEVKKALGGKAQK